MKKTKEIISDLKDGKLENAQSEQYTVNNPM